MKKVRMKISDAIEMGRFFTGILIFFLLIIVIPVVFLFEATFYVEGKLPDRSLVEMFACLTTLVVIGLLYGSIAERIDLRKIMTKLTGF